MADESVPMDPTNPVHIAMAQRLLANAGVFGEVVSFHGLRATDASVLAIHSQSPAAVRDRVREEFGV